MKAPRSHVAAAFLVMDDRSAIGMLATIKLDDQANFKAGEIGEIATY